MLPEELLTRRGSDLPVESMQHAVDEAVSEVRQLAERLRSCCDLFPSQFSELLGTDSMSEDPAVAVELDNPHTPEQCAALLRKTDDLHLRMIAVATAANRHSETSLEQVLSKRDGESPRPALNRWRGELTSIRMANKIVLLLPEVTPGLKCWELLEGFNEFYLAEGMNTDWVIDCSGLRRPEMLVLSSLLGYRRQLAQSGARLSLIWVTEQAIPQEFLPRFLQNFNLVERAGHYFSN